MVSLPNYNDFVKVTDLFDKDIEAIRKAFNRMFSEKPLYRMNMVSRLYYLLQSQFTQKNVGKLELLHIAAESAKVNNALQWISEWIYDTDEEKVRVAGEALHQLVKDKPWLIRSHDMLAAMEYEAAEEVKDQMKDIMQKIHQFQADHLIDYAFIVGLGMDDFCANDLAEAQKKMRQIRDPAMKERAREKLDRLELLYLTDYLPKAKSAELEACHAFLASKEIPPQIFMSAKKAAQKSKPKKKVAQKSLTVDLSREICSAKWDYFQHRKLIGHRHAYEVYEVRLTRLAEDSPKYSDAILAHLCIAGK